MSPPPREDDAREVPRYSAPPRGELSREMVEAYREAGVLVLEGFVSPEACDRLRARTLQLVETFDPAAVRSVFSTTGQHQLDDRYFIESGDKIRFFLEADAFGEDGRLRGEKRNCLNKMGHAMHDIDLVFDGFSRTPELAEVADRLGAEDSVLIQSMYIFKPPRIGGEVLCHQDSTYIYTEPESCMGLWFALDDATTENGCLYFIPGMHRGPLKARNYRVGPYRLKTDVLDASPWPEHLKRPAEVPKGTLVVFDGRTPHLSGANRSDCSRHAYALHAVNLNCRYPTENWLQRSAQLPLRGFRG